MNPFAVYLLVGIALALIGVGSLRKGSQKQKRCTVSAVAEIVEIQVDADEADRGNTRKKYTYTPVFRFAAGGKIIRKTGGVYSHSKRQYAVGDTAAIKINPENPEEFTVEGEKGGKGFGAALMIFGLLLIALAFTQR